MQVPRLSKLSFGLAVVTTLLTAGLILAENPVWDPDPSIITPSTDHTGKACDDRTGQAPCAYVVDTCYKTGGVGGVIPQPNPANNTIVKSVKAVDKVRWGRCLAQGATPENTCTEYSYLDCMYFNAYSQLECEGEVIKKEDMMTPVLLMLTVRNACRPNARISFEPPVETED